MRLVSSALSLPAVLVMFGGASCGGGPTLEPPDVTAPERNLREAGSAEPSPEAGLAMGDPGDAGTMVPCLGVPGRLFVDDFERGNACAWQLSAASGVTLAVQDGKLAIVQATGPQAIVTTPASISFDNTETRAFVRRPAGSGTTMFGVACRVRGPGDFYAFLARTDGRYAIAAIEGGQMAVLSGGGHFTYTDALNQGAATNMIGGTCSGDSLSLRINGILLETVTDKRFSVGAPGVTAFTDGAPATIHFDDFVVDLPM